MSEDQPKRSTCDECRLFTLLTYPDGRIICNNYACTLYVPPVRCEVCEDD